MSKTAKSADPSMFCPENQIEWRNWLAENHHTEQSVWLVFYKKSSPQHNLGWSEAVDEALCFGWIDSVKYTLDKERYKQLFSRRKPNSIWSKINKDKVDTLLSKGLMTDAGMECVRVAKANGQWTLMDSVERLEIPPDLQKAFDITPGSLDFFRSFSMSLQKQMLVTLVLAKQVSTRQKRLDAIVTAMKNQELPKGIG